ncbi:MAG: hypothetical protein ACI4JB_02460 [Porcipelethomonas sp.]
MGNNRPSGWNKPGNSDNNWANNKKESSKGNQNPANQGTVNKNTSRSSAAGLGKTNKKKSEPAAANVVNNGAVAEKTSEKNKTIIPVVIIFSVFIIFCVVLVLVVTLNKSDVPEKTLKSAANIRTEQSATTADTAPVPTTESMEEQDDSAGSEKENEDIPCPESYEQYLSVVSDGSKAKFKLYEWDNEWKEIWKADGYVGEDGVSSKSSEYNSATPKGQFDICFAYGLSEPETGIEFIELDSDSVWVDDPDSYYYNTLTSKSNVGSAHYEDTYSQFTAGYFSTNIYFNNNGDGVSPGSAEPDKGSVITICGYNGDLGPTAGCIDISSSDMKKLLKLLDKDKYPVIIIE